MIGRNQPTCENGPGSKLLDMTYDIWHLTSEHQKSRLILFLCKYLNLIFHDETKRKASPNGRYEPYHMARVPTLSVALKNKFLTYLLRGVSFLQHKHVLFFDPIFQLRSLQIQMNFRNIHNERLKTIQEFYLKTK